MKCLKITTIDGRIIYTHKKHQNKLKLFEELFNLEAIETLSPTELIDIKQLPKLICSNNNKKIKEKKKTPSSEIQQFITNEFYTKKSINLVDLKAKFNNFHVSTICNHVKKVMDKLKKNNLSIKKISKGRYEII